MFNPVLYYCDFGWIRNGPEIKSALECVRWRLFSDLLFLFFKKYVYIGVYIYIYTNVQYPMTNMEMNP